MCPTMNPGTIGYDQWSDSARRLAAIASSVSLRVSGQGSIQLQLIGVTGGLWRLDRSLRDFIQKIYKISETSVPIEPVLVSEEQIHSAIALLKSIYEPIDKLYNTGRAMGLTNRAITGAVLNSIKVRGDEIFDVADSIELSYNPNVNAVFDQSLEALQRGECFGLSALK